MTFDLIVLGGGPAGIVAATTASSLGKTVALVDNHPDLGGAGANTGTVPSKTLRETALALSGMRSRNLYGVDLSLRREATVSDFLCHERSVKAGMNHSLALRMEENKVHVCQGTGVFVDNHHVRVEESGALLEGDFILIATGSSPVRPPDIPFDLPEVYDSDTILELDRLPASLAVIGAGVIGAEYACTFAALGSEVHVIDGRDVLLQFLDTEISNALKVAMERNGVIFHWQNRCHCCATSNGRVALDLSAGGRLEVDAILVAAGRKSNVEKLNLAAAGVVSGEHGQIAVDDRYRTNIPHILAVGDVIGFPALASTSMDQARRAVRHAFSDSSAPGLLSENASKLLPTGVYTIPEASMIGETEDALKKASVDYVAGRGHYRSSARGRIIGDADGFLKLLFRRGDMKLLGVHAIGEQATELVHIGLMAMLVGASAEIFDEACFNIPTLGQLYKVAALDAVAASRRM